jgi:hypothetical protein
MTEILRTLSVIRASNVWFDFYAELKADKVSTKEWTMPLLNCRELADRDPGTATMNEVAQWNHCIRNAALKAPSENIWNQSLGYLNREDLKRNAPEILKLLK